MASRSPNHLLASLSGSDFELLGPHLRSVELVREAVLAEAGDTLARAYFPHSGVISLVVSLAGREMVEVAMVGRDSVFGATAALDGGVSLHDAIVQLPGVASVINIARLRTATEQSVSLRNTLIRHEQVILMQAQQSAACNATHAVEARLTRWLLRARDLAGSDSLPLTQEFLAQMLGVRRNSVSLVAHTLQRAGVIRYHRGHIEITNLEGLKEGCCECYEMVNAHCDRLLNDTGPQTKPERAPPSSEKLLKVVLP